MNLRISLWPIACLACPAILASSPGQPIDCSDWVFIDPGYTCTEMSCGIEDDNSYDYCNGIYNYSLHDNEGNLMRVSRISPFTSCPGGLHRGRTQIVRYDGTTEHVIAYVDDRCAPGNQVDIFGSESSSLFDGMNGRLLFKAVSYCPNSCYPTDYRLMVISGFTTAMEIFQSFTPTANAVQFRVPKMPEGFPAADHFDTYAGVLAHPIDFGSAQPLQCNYPESAPNVGDYFCVADTLPAPEPGHGYYYVTAVTHDGQRRYGRKRIDGVNSGRDPALLPACSR